MTCTVCPNCGIDLERFAPILRGDIEVTAYEVRWKGRRVPLRPSGKMIVSALVRADGLPVSLCAITELLGSDDAGDPANVAAVQICHARRAFREVDPTFQAIETVRAIGVRWAA
jgi:DNA-binding response OmpR family regulator